MKIILNLLIVTFIFFTMTVCGQNQAEDFNVWEPVPDFVETGDDHFRPPPSDAIILFDGTSLDQWQKEDGSDPEWSVENGAVTVNPGTGDIKTRQSFKDVHLYLEWRSPEEVESEGQGRGNSGVFLQNRYELQVLDNWENPTYVNGMAGSIYKQHIPLVNPAKRPGEWQSYEIIYRAPVFSDNEELAESARITVIHNGVMVQNNVEIFGNTWHASRPSYQYHEGDGIRLQDHSDLVSFRNIWIREPDDDIHQAGSGITWD